MNIEIYSGTSNKTGKPYEAIKVTIGKWNTLVFPRSSFEMDYIKQYLADEAKKNAR